VAREYASTNAAVRATRGQVVTYRGRPAITYFFSTSGGRTENIENSFIGATPEPWLRSVPDPYDSISPRHRWTLRMSFATATRLLGPNIRGRFEGIRVTKRGRSPRIIYANVLGTRGKTRVTGSILRGAFSGYDTWMRFSAIGTKKKKKKRAPAGSSPSGPGGGAAPARADRLPAQWLGGLEGTVISDGVHAATVQRRTGGRWVRVARLRLGTHGGYSWTAPRHGAYRILAAGDPGPSVTL
jgi:stage II sporulation protein D